MGALIVAIGIAIYPSRLQTQLIDAINTVDASVTGLAALDPLQKDEKARR